MVGRTFSHYELLEKLGEGGMGVVYKARDLKLNRLVALKFLPPYWMASPDRVARFEQEARAISALNHANIATIYDLDQDAGQKFLVLEYLPGGTLKTKIQQLHSTAQPLSIPEVVRYAAEMAEGLGHAHRRGIIHRDVKSDNAMFTEEGALKITDFGLAKGGEGEPLTRGGSLLGTVAYMSPEQAQGLAVDPRTDIYSLGMVMYEMAAGRLFFQTSQEVGLLYEIVHTPPPPLKPYRPDAPDELETVVFRALRKNREERYPRMEELLADLRALREGSGVSVARGARPGSGSGVRAALEPAIPGIAVLPFLDMSPQKDQEYFCDGIAEELINALSQLPRLRVVCRSSAFHFKGQACDIQEIGAKLRVNTVLEGSVRRAGDRLRISVQLVNVADGFQLWSQRFDREMRDVFAIQDEISRAIVDTLKVKLAGEPGQRLVPSGPGNLEAYSLCLKGRYCWNKRTPEGLVKSIEYFQQAIAADPSHALSYAGLADSYIILALFGTVAPSNAWPKAKEAAAKALELDDTLGAAHASMGAILSTYEWDWAKAELEFQRALALNPGDATARHWYAVHYLAPMGRLEEAVAELRSALELDPLNLVINANLGAILYFQRAYDSAIEQCRKTFELEPNYYFTYWVLGRAYEQKGMPEEAVAALEKSAVLSGGAPLTLGTLGHAYAACGRVEEARQLLSQLEEKSKTCYVPSIAPSVVLQGLGEKDHTLDRLEQALEERSGFLIWYNVDPRFDPLRADPRFQAIMRKVGLIHEEPAGFSSAATRTASSI